MLTVRGCTPAWLGRDPTLLRRLSEASGLHIVTNTGYYGAAQDKYIPAHAFDESAERLAERWTAEWRDGIEGTGIAQNEKDRAFHLRAAVAGAWIELDGVAEESLDTHVAAVVDLARKGHLKRVLVSQDAGWYRVGEPAGGRFRPYTFLFDGFVPALRRAGLRDADVRTLLVDNPARLLGLPA